MAFSYEQTTAAGGSALVNVPFPYIAKTHVTLHLNGALQSGYTWLNDQTIQMGGPIAGGTTQLVRRTTPADEPLVTFVKGQFDESDLNLSERQSLYLNQEDVDNLGDLKAEFEEFESNFEADVAAAAASAAAAAGSAGAAHTDRLIIEALIDDATQLGTPADGTVTNAKVAAGAGINLSKLGLADSVTWGGVHTFTQPPVLPALTELGGGWRVGNLRADNNAALPASKMDITADFATFYNPTTQKTHTEKSGLALSPSILTQGLLGRDQAGAFATNDTLWAYYIDGAAVAPSAVWSKIKPGAGGPDLSNGAFAGYTSFCPLFPILLYNSAQGLNPTSPLIGAIRYKVRGHTVHYPRTPLFDDHMNFPLMNFDISGWVPPDAHLSLFYIDAEMGSGAGGGVTGGAYGHTSEGEFVNISLYPPGPSTMAAQDVFCSQALPSTRAFQLTFAAAGGAGNIAFVIGDIFVSGYTFSNGGG